MKARTYHSQAVGSGSIAWAKNSFGAISSAPAYLKVDPWATSTNAGDRVAIVNDAGTASLLDPATGTALVSAATGGSFSKTAVVVSGDNQRLYMLTKNGKLLVVRASDLTVANTVTLNASGTAFVGLAPVLDYGSNTSGGNTDFGSSETLYAVSQDGTTYRIDVARGTTGTPTVTTTAYATALGTATVLASPVAWKGKVYWGSTAGNFYEVNFSNAAAPTSRSWGLAQYTTATGNGAGIDAPAALDFDSSFNVNAVFVPCGDRVNWLNPQTGQVTTSASLTLDSIPAAGIANKLSNYTSASPNALAANNAADWVAIKSQATPTPTEWGGGSAFPTIQNTIASATSVRVHPTTGEIWVTDNTNAKVARYNSAGTLLGSVTLGSTNNGPIKLEFDGGGNCWVSVGSISGGGTVAKYDSTGTLIWSKAVSGALYVAPERTGAGPYGCWEVNYAGGSISKLDQNGNVVLGPYSLPGITTIFTDANNTCWATVGYGGGGTTVYKYASNGTRTGPFTTGSDPIYVAFDPVNQNAWITDNSTASGTPGTTGKVTELVNATGALSTTLSGLGDHPWAVRFDPSGTPWLTHMNYPSTAAPRTLERITKATGAQEALFSFASIGAPFEMDFETNGTCWVACTPGGLFKILDIGNTQDLFASSYRLIASRPDGDDSYAFLKFKVPINAYANYAVSGAYLKLTAATTPPGTDDIEIYDASSLHPTTGNPWVGYSGTPNVDYNTRPTVTTPYIVQKTGVQYSKDTAYNFTIPVPSDQKNSPDTANALWTYAVRTTNKQLRNAVHWYSQTSAAGTTSKYPSLNVTLAGAAKLPTTGGIACMAGVDSTNQKVWVVACNALFELDYSSQTARASAASTTYNLTAQGRLATPSPIYTVPSPKTYIFPAGNAILTFRNHLIVPDLNPANGDMWLNNFDVTTPGNTADHLYYQVDAGNGTGSPGSLPLASWDYDGGGLYMVTGNNNVIRAIIVQ